MNDTTSITKNHRVLPRLIVLAIMLLGIAASDQTDYNNRVSFAKSEFRRLEPKLIDANEKAQLNDVLNDLAQQAAALSAVDTNVPVSSSDLETARSRVVATMGEAAGLRQQADQAKTYAENVNRQLALLIGSICSQKGGSLRGTDCTFTCRSDQMNVCNDKVADSERATAGLRNNISISAKNAQDAEARANEAEERYTDAQNAFDALSKQSQDAAEHARQAVAFDNMLDNFYTRLESARRKPRPIKNEGTAWRQAIADLQHYQHGRGMAFDARGAGLAFDCVDTLCSDFGTKTDGSLVLPAEPLPTGVPSSSSTYTRRQSELQSGVARFNNQLVDTAAAIHNNDPSKDQKISALTNTMVKVQEIRRSSLFESNNLTTISKTIGQIHVPEPGKN